MSVVKMPKAIIVLKHRSNQVLNVIKHQHVLSEKKKGKTADAKPKAGKKRGGKAGKRKVL